MTSATKEEAPRSPRESASRKPLSEQAPDPDDLPPGGPHAEPHLTNPDATPGAGALTPAGDHPQNRFDKRLNATCEIGRASCRERVEMSVVDGGLRRESKQLKG